MYVNILRIKINYEFWDQFSQAVKHLYQTYNNCRIDPAGSIGILTLLIEKVGN